MIDKQKNKIIWTLVAVTVSGLTTYSTFMHSHENDKFRTCAFCSIGKSGMAWFMAGICVTGAFYAWQK